jgi:hypothetical protein
MNDPPQELTLDNVVAFLMKAIEGAIAPPNAMTRKERKKHYPGMPIVAMNAAERERLLEKGEWLRENLRLLQGVLAYKLDYHQSRAKDLLAELLISAFDIGRQSQYNLAEMRQAKDASKAQGQKMRDAKRPFAEYLKGVICNCLEGYFKTNPNDKGQTANYLAVQIRPEVNAALKAQGKKDIQVDAIRKRLNGLLGKRSG